MFVITEKQARRNQVKACRQKERERNIEGKTKQLEGQPDRPKLQ